MAQFALNSHQHPVPSSPEAFKALVETLQAQHQGLRERTLLYVLKAQGGGPRRPVASMVGEGKYGTLHLLFEVLGRPEFGKSGMLVAPLNEAQLAALLQAFTPYLSQAEAHPNVAFLDSCVKEKIPVECVLVNRDAGDPAVREAYIRFRTTLMFDLFNEGALRGADGNARQALLDSFSTLPNRYLTADGQFLIDGSTEPSFLRSIPSYGKLESGVAIGGIDKFPSLMNVRAERLLADGNRIIPGAMIRDGAYIGKRNIFMFHAAVNIAAYVGDDNLIDSHASVASAAQIGNKNKIGSFVSLEGVLSPANAVPVFIGDENFIGSFARVGTGIKIGNKNFIGSGVNLSLGTKIRDCRTASPAKGEYVTPRDLNDNFNSLAIVPNNATREFHGVNLVPGEYAVFENSEDFMARFEGDTRIKGKV